MFDRQFRAVAMKLGLQVKGVWDDPDVIEVAVRADDGHFAGTAEVYVGVQELSSTAKILRGFPATPDDRRIVQWGEFKPESAGGAISMSFVAEPAGHGGVVDIRVESDERKTGCLQSATVRLQIEGAALDGFLAALEELEESKNGVAFLPHGCG